MSAANGAGDGCTKVMLRLLCSDLHREIMGLVSERERAVHTQGRQVEYFRACVEWVMTSSCRTCWRVGKAYVEEQGRTGQERPEMEPTVREALKHLENHWRVPSKSGWSNLKKKIHPLHRNSLKGYGER